MNLYVSIAVNSIIVVILTLVCASVIYFCEIRITNALKRNGV